MVLASFQTIADSLSLSFLYGEKTAFTIGVDYANPDLVVLYHEGYVSGQAAEDTQGAWENTYSLRLWLCIKSNGPNDKPIDRSPRFSLLEPLMARILSKLSDDYVISQPVTFSEFINTPLADVPLDGIRFVANCKPKGAPTVYC